LRSCACVDSTIRSDDEKESKKPPCRAMLTFGSSGRSSTPGSSGKKKRTPLKLAASLAHALSVCRAPQRDEELSSSVADGNAALLVT